MSESRYTRKPPFRQTREEVLVVCGGHTEQIYFDAFKQVFRPSLGNVSVITAVEVKSYMQIIEYSIKYRRRKDSYTAVWCVFDKDDFPDFDDAVTYAKQNRISTAFSNQAFEVWFINHFRSFYSALHRNKYKDELSKLLSFPYEKSQDVISKICGILLTEDLVKTAAANARFGYEWHKSHTIPVKPSVFESCTTVYLLVRSLLNWAE